MPYVGPTSLVRWLGGRDLAGAIKSEAKVAATAVLVYRGPQERDRLHRVTASESRSAG